MNPVFHQSSRARLLLRASAPCLALLLGGCASSPPVRYFTLQGPVAEACAKAPTASEVAARSVQLLHVSVPDVVDRPQLVFRTGDNTLSVNETARWAEPLKSALSSLLASELAQALGCVPVVLRSTGIEDTAWKLSVDVRRLEARPGQSVVLEAVWSLRGNAKAFSRRSLIQEAVVGESLEAMVAAQSRAVAGLARDIARLIESPG
jgi:hypothetical protein